MSTVSVVTGGAHSATSYTGSGAGLTNIPVSALAGSTPNNVVITNGSGGLTTASTLSTTLGGTGQNFSGVTGPSIVTITSGAAAATLAYSASATASTIVQRDGSANIVGAGGTFSSVTTPSIATSSGNLTLSPNSGTTSLGTGTLAFAPSAVAGGAVTMTSANVQTTNATATTLYSFTSASGGTHGTSYYFQCAITLADTTGGVNTGSYSFNFKAKNIGGTVTISGLASTESVLDSGLSTTSVSVTASSANIQIQVTGIASTTINWCGQFRISAQNF